MASSRLPNFTAARVYLCLSSKCYLFTSMSVFLSRLQTLFPLQLRVALDQRSEDRVMTMSSHR